MKTVARLAIIALAGCCSLAGAAQSPSPDLAAALTEFQLSESGRTAKELIPGWVTPKKLVVVVDKPERIVWLQQAMPAGTTVVGVRREAEIAALLPEADALVEVNCAIAVGAEAPKLRWLHGNSGGGDTCLLVNGIAKGEVILTNSQKVKNTVLAEMGMGYVFALARSVDVGLENQRQRDLNRRGGRAGKRLEGATMLIIGLGGAGTEIARMAHAIGMKVIATDPVNRTPPDFVSHVGLPDELPSLIGQADVVMVAAPLTPSTRGLFNAAMFARMKRDAIFVNWTRADIVVAEDLAAALKAGTIGSAALNWASQTPLSRDHPLWEAPNLILAPWAGASVAPSSTPSPNAARDNEMRWLVVRENMRRFATGARMYSVFDLARGY
jgi:phosphoglycerate dehydrogenase-like enzyme